MHDCAGDWGGTAVTGDYYLDSDGDGFGDPNADNLYCSAFVPSGWVADKTDTDDDCFSNIHDCVGVCDGTAIVDGCGVCDGGNADQDCAGVCFGSSVYDNCIAILYLLQCKLIFFTCYFISNKQISFTFLNSPMSSCSVYIVSFTSSSVV